MSGGRAGGGETIRSARIGLGGSLTLSDLGGAEGWFDVTLLTNIWRARSQMNILTATVPRTSTDAIAVPGDPRDKRPGACPRDRCPAGSSAVANPGGASPVQSLASGAPRVRPSGGTRPLWSGNPNRAPRSGANARAAGLTYRAPAMADGRCRTRAMLAARQAVCGQNFIRRGTGRPHGAGADLASGAGLEARSAEPGRDAIRLRRPPV